MHVDIQFSPVYVRVTGCKTIKLLKPTVVVVPHPTSPPPPQDQVHRVNTENTRHTCLYLLLTAALFLLGSYGLLESIPVGTGSEE